MKFVLLTGVTKFFASKVCSVASTNQKDISMDERYESLCGITQEELEKYFAEPISRLATKYECTVEEMKDWLKRQYDAIILVRTWPPSIIRLALLNDL